MALTVSQIQAARSRPELTQLTSTDLIRVRALYLERRYKQCIQMCEGLLKPNLHPLQETFRLFHQAICYEALGLAAHNYSRNKIPFFDSAKEKFETALDALPQPFANDEAGRSDAPQQSPLAVVFRPSISQITDSEETSEVAQMPFIQVSSRTRTPSEASSHYSSSSSSVSDTYTVPDLENYSPRPDLLTAPKSLPRTVTFPDVQKQEQEWNKAGHATSGDDLEATPRQTRQPSYQNRLSACLSSRHLLDEELVPSPLFSRTKKTVYIPFSPIAANLSSKAAPQKGTVPITEPPRPLPRPPHTHLTHHTLFPPRRTAVQTLISKYEKTLPSPTSSSDTTSASAVTPSPHPTATPTTARFAAVASAFAPIEVSTSPTPAATTSKTNVELTISNYLTSHALARYNTHLSSFATSLRASISRVESIIDEAHEIQERHMLEKQEAVVREAQENGGLGRARMASYWLLTPSTPSTPITPLPRKLSVPAPAPTPCKSASAIASTTTQPLSKLRVHLRTTKPEETDLKRRQRIEKLRACGFEVRKERYGWKGGRYYEELRRRVEVELGV